MANFEEAFLKTMGHEGKYANDPLDFGGETYMGVSRRYWPDWDGWYIIDSLKSDPNFSSILNDNIELNNKVKSFYKINFWNTFLGDNINDQNIADELFDTGVNMSVYTAVKFLQKALNLLNNNGKRYPDIAEDGKIGPNTLNTLESYMRQKDKSYLLKVMNILQGCHYIESMERCSSQERFAFGWMDRVEIIKK